MRIINYKTPTFKYIKNTGIRDHKKSKKCKLEKLDHKRGKTNKIVALFLPPISCGIDTVSGIWTFQSHSIFSRVLSISSFKPFLQMVVGHPHSKSVDSQRSAFLSDFNATERQTSLGSIYTRFRLIPGKNGLSWQKVAFQLSREGTFDNNF